MNKVLLSAVAIFCVGVTCGVALQYYRIPGRVKHRMLPQAEQRTERNLISHGTLDGDESVEREQHDINQLKSKRLIVAIVFGQSNSANHGDSRHTSCDKVFNFYLNKLYRAEDPLLGATGDGGTVWTRLGDLIIHEEMYDAVVFAPIGVGDSTVQRWAPGGDCHPRLIHTLADLRSRGIPCTHLLWHQGESDHQTSQSLYKERFERMVDSIRTIAPNSSILVSIATRHMNGDISPAIQAAQHSLINPSRHVYAGPNTDELGDSFRNAIDHIHFNDKGQDEAAKLWLEAIVSADTTREELSLVQ